MLEGNQAAVDKALERIIMDGRLIDLRLLAERHIDTRVYTDWSMGYLHDMALEDNFEALVFDDRPEPTRVIDVMERMRPDPVMGASR